MGAYSQVLNTAQLTSLVTQLLTTINASKSKAEIIIQMSCLSEMSKYLRSKLAPFLLKIIPLLQGLMMKVDPKNNDDQNELTGACLETLQQIVKSCPVQCATHIPDLFKNALTLLEYDPNYAYDVNVKMTADDDDGGWGSDFEEAQDQVDEDDSSWKVRKGAVDLFSAIIKANKNFHTTIIDKYAN